MVIVVRNIADLMRQLLANQDQVEIFSFDIFDTLLARRIDPPEYIHTLHAEYIAEKLGRYDSKTILAIRYREEALLRQRSLQEGFDRECHHHDILTAMAAHLTDENEASSLIEWMREKELFLETQALFVLPGVFEMLESLNKTGKKIIAVSDMYLGKAEIEHLFRNKGILDYFDHIFVSSEDKRCKYSGRFFKDIQKKFAIPFEKIIHAGDNKYADYKVPAKLGISAVLLDSPDEKYRRAISRKYARLSANHDFWKGRHFVQIAFSTQYGCEESKQKFYQQYGYNTLSPIFCSFVHGLIRYIEENEIQHIYFLARDGYLIQKIYDKLVEQIAPGQKQRVKSDYLYLSRQSVAPASVWDGMDHLNATLPLNNPKQQGLLSILKAYCLPVEEFLELATLHGFEEIDQSLSKNDPRLSAFLADENVQRIIKDSGIAAQNILQQYLKSHGFFEHKRVAFIDIGWNGTIQYFTSQAFGNREDYPEVAGLYFAYCGGISFPFQATDTVKGFLYDERNKDPSERIVVGFEELFEESSKGCHATTIGYKKTSDGRVEALFKDDDSFDRQEEKKCDPLVLRLQQGILDFIPVYLDAFCLTKYDFTMLKPFMLFLVERAVAYPNIEEVQKLTNLTHTEDWGHNNVMDLGKIKYDIFWRDIRGALKRSNWNYGTMRMRGGRFLGVLYRFMMIAKGFLK